MKYVKNKQYDMYMCTKMYIHMFFFYYDSGLSTLISSLPRLVSVSAAELLDG